jgi:hypothetical protein
MTQRSSTDHQDSDGHDDDDGMNPGTIHLSESQSLLRKSQLQALTHTQIERRPKQDNDNNTDTDPRTRSRTNSDLPTSETGKESDNEFVELVGRRNQSQSIPYRSSMNYTADHGLNQEDECDFKLDDTSCSSSQVDDRDESSSDEFLPTQEVKRMRTSTKGKAKVLSSLSQPTRSRPRRKCTAAQSRAAIDAVPSTSTSSTATASSGGNRSAMDVSSPLPGVMPKKSRQSDIVPKSKQIPKSLTQYGPKGVVACLKVLSKLSDKLCALTNSSSNNSVQKIMNNIFKTMQDLFSMDYRACAIDVINVTAQIVKGAFGLRKRHAEEVVVLVKFCIHCELESASSEDIYNTSYRTVEDSGALVNDAGIVLVVLDLLVMVSSDDGSMKEEQFAMPLLNLLWAVPEDLLVEHISNLDSEHIGDCLLKLVTSIPKLHSYRLIESTLGVIYNLRYCLLSSIDQLPKEERSARIQLFLIVFDSIPYNCLEGIEALDPPLSNTTIKQLYKDGATMYQDQSFLQWSREHITDLTCDHISCYACNGICKYSIFVG